MEFLLTAEDGPKLSYDPSQLRDIYRMTPLGYAVAFQRHQIEAILNRLAADLAKQQETPEKKEEDDPELWIPDDGKDSGEDSQHVSAFPEAVLPKRPVMSGIEKIQVQLLLDTQHAAESWQKPERSLDALLKWVFPDG